MDHSHLVASIFELDWWAIMAPQIALALGLGALIGGPAGYLYWRKTSRIGVAVAIGISVGAVGLLFLAVVYYMTVLCPPGAGCV